MSYRAGTGMNRRKMDRFRASLQVSVVRSGLIRRRSISGVAVDYNRYGLALVSPARLRLRMNVHLNIRSEHMLLRKVDARVVSCVRTGKEYRIGLRFYRTLKDFAEPALGHPLHFLLGLEEALQEPS